MPQKRGLRDAVPERPRPGALCLQRRPAGAAAERCRRRDLPRVPRVDAAAACVRLAGVQRGCLLRRLRRVRSLRHSAWQCTGGCSGKTRQFLHDGNVPLLRTETVFGVESALVVCCNFALTSISGRFPAVFAVPADDVRRHMAGSYDNVAI